MLGRRVNDPFSSVDASGRAGVTVQSLAEYGGTVQGAGSSAPFSGSLGSWPCPLKLFTTEQRVDAEGLSGLILHSSLVLPLLHLRIFLV